MSCNVCLPVELTDLILASLDIRSLSRAEQAGLSRVAVEASWSRLAASVDAEVEDRPLHSQLKPSSKCPKVRLKTQLAIRDSFSQVLGEWAPAISSPSRLCLVAHPKEHSTRIGGTVEAAPQQVTPPRFACVPLEMGIRIGKSMSFGAHMERTTLIQQSEGCLIGIEMRGVAKGARLTSTLCFAPFSGRCFMRLSEDFVMWAQLMGPTEAESVSTWVEVTADGGIRFFREDRDAVQTSGIIPRIQCIHPDAWPIDYFSNFCFQIDQLSSRVEASIKWMCVDLPTVARHDDSLECGVPWSVMVNNS